jgi:hypothetical protein
MSAAQELVDLAHEELGLLAAGRIDELAGVQGRRDGVLARLDVTGMSTGERAALVQAHALQVQITALLEKATYEAAGRLSRLDRGRQGLRAYAASLKQA